MKKTIIIIRALILLAGIILIGRGSAYQSHHRREEASKTQWA
jgi:hypothetical protein